MQAERRGGELRHRGKELLGRRQKKDRNAIEEETTYLLLQSMQRDGSSKGTVGKFDSQEDDARIGKKGGARRLIAEEPILLDKQEAIKEMRRWLYKEE